MRQAFKFQLMRSKRTQHLDRSIDFAAQMWNHSVALDRRYYKLFGKSLKQAQLEEHLAKLRRTRFPHWRRVDSQSLQAVSNRLYRGWDAWFKREIKRRPTFRSRPSQTRSSRQDWPSHRRGLRIEDFPGAVHRGKNRLSATVKTGASEASEREPEPFPQQKGSHSRRKARLALARLHRRVSHQRTHFQWQLAFRLLKEFDDLAFEDLNPKAMHRIWGRTVGDLGFRGFLAKQEWLAEEYGRRVDKAPRFESTTKRRRRCSVTPACRRLWSGADSPEAVWPITAESHRL